MAFAVKVMNARQKITNCPFVAQENNEPVSQKTAITMDDNYERVSNELEADAKCVDFEETAAAVRKMMDERFVPPVNDKRCKDCSLKESCLPAAIQDKGKTRRMAERLFVVE